MFLIIKRFLLIVLLAFAVLNALPGEIIFASEQKDTRARVFVETVVKSRITETTPVIGRFVALQHGAAGVTLETSLSTFLVLSSKRRAAFMKRCGSTRKMGN